MSMLSCTQIRARIADGNADAALLAHAAGCEECRPILAALAEIDQELAALPTIDASDALVARTLERANESDDVVSSPSLLAAALAMLVSALLALFAAPMIALRWLIGVGTGPKETSIEDRGKTKARGGIGFAPVFALGSVIVGVVASVTLFRSGSATPQTRAAEMIINGLPGGAFEPEAPAAGDDFWGANMDRGFEGSGAAQGSVRPVPRDWGDLPMAAPSAPSTGGALDGRFRGETALAPDEQLVANQHDVVDALTLQERPTVGYVGATESGEGDGLASDAPSEHAHAAAQTTTTDQSVTHHGRGPAAVTDESRALSGRDGDEQAQRVFGPMGQTRELAAAEHGEGQRTRLLEETTGGFDEDGEADRGLLDHEAAARTPAPPTAWELAQATSGLTFASSQSWWANTYVPGDARLRVLHTRLAASPSLLAGTTLSALALAETASPTVPAVAPPSDRAIAIGVHADVAAIEGPTRVRLEIALRAIEQASGRRGALRIALVVDARSALSEDATTHLRSLLGALSHSLTPRDRVIVTAAGAQGGTLVPLGVLRHGQVEVALRHLAAPSSGGVSSDGIAMSLDEALAAGLEAVATNDDGAGLALLVTPDGSHDAAVDQALHLGAVAGVATTAVGIGSGASTSSLDAIALAGEGRRRLVLSDDDATRAVREELTAASRLVARALRVRIHLADGVQLVDVVGSHALGTEETRRTRESERAIDQELARRLGIGQDRDDDDSGVRILVPSFYSGDAHTIVLDLLVTRPGPVADVDVRFKDLVRLGNGTASAALTLEAGTAARGPHELRVVASFVAHDVASALDDAADALERGDAGAARARLVSARALLDQARASIDGLASVPSIAADLALLDRFVSALDAASDRSVADQGLVAASLHYAAARRIVIPQLQSSTP